jgi:hypothetical protein
MITKVFAIAGLALALFTSAGLFAADEVVVDKSSDKMHARFDSHIDSWAVGTLVKMDLEGKKFTIKGQKLPYATAHAQMKQEIRSKTEGLDANAREAKIAEIKKNWADKLEKAKNEELAAAADISFAFPAKGTLSIHEMRDVPDMAWMHMRKGAEPQPIPASAREEKAEPKNLNFSDLKVGDRVMIGYDSGVITNEAYTILRESEPADKAAQPAR